MSETDKPLIDKLLKKNILIIDDDGLITKTLCDLLKRSGYYTDASQDGLDGAQKAQAAEFDLIICDIKMPQLNGLETIKKIRHTAKANKRRAVPVLFITGYADSELTAEARKMGEVLLKPFEAKDFLDKVAKYL
jgi:CheY-like chemotaxis protein